MRANHVPCPYIIITAADHEFHLINRLQIRKVGKVIAAFHAASRCFDIKNDHRTSVDIPYAERTVRLDQYGIAGIKESADQRQQLRSLKKRFTAGHLYQ